MDGTRTKVESELQPGAAPAAGEVRAEPVKPWEMIEDGRYQPRRIRGSCLGRVLG